MKCWDHPIIITHTHTRSLRVRCLILNGLVTIRKKSYVFASNAWTWVNRNSALRTLDTFYQAADGDHVDESSRCSLKNTGMSDECDCNDNSDEHNVMEAVEKGAWCWVISECLVLTAFSAKKGYIRPVMMLMMTVKIKVTMSRTLFIVSHNFRSIVFLLDDL